MSTSGYEKDAKSEPCVCIYMNLQKNYQYIFFSVEGFRSQILCSVPVLQPFVFIAPTRAYLSS